ncbi:hypothetical protein ACVI1L_000883 [Bradyrhizobium sp. USDA 4516]
MRHIDHADAAARRLADRVEQDTNFIRSQGRCRFIEDQQAHLAHQCLGDLGHLAVGERQRADCCLGIEGNAELAQERPGPGHQFALADKAEPRTRLAAEQQIVGDAQRLDETEVLIDDGDACLARSSRTVERSWFAGDLDRAAVGRVDTTKDLDQRGLAGPVLAQQRVHLAGPDLEVDVAQRPHAAEASVDATDHQQRRRRPRLGCDRTGQFQIFLPSTARGAGTMVTYCYFCNLSCYNSITSADLSMGDRASGRSN